MITRKAIHIHLEPAPIEPAWILDGYPMASSRILFESPDRMATTLIWECTPGKFEWHYDSEESIILIEGIVTLSNEAGIRELHRGDAAVFVPGDVVLWDVKERVRKFAVWRTPLGKTASLAMRGARRLGL